MKKTLSQLTCWYQFLHVMGVSVMCGFFVLADGLECCLLRVPVTGCVDAIVWVSIGCLLLVEGIHTGYGQGGMIISIFLFVDVHKSILLSTNVNVKHGLEEYHLNSL